MLPCKYCCWTWNTEWKPKVTNRLMEKGGQWLTGNLCPHMTCGSLKAQQCWRGRPPTADWTGAPWLTHLWPAYPCKLHHSQTLKGPLKLRESWVLLTSRGLSGAGTREWGDQRGGWWDRLGHLRGRGTAVITDCWARGKRVYVDQLLAGPWNPLHTFTCRGHWMEEGDGMRHLLYSKNTKYSSSSSTSNIPGLLFSVSLVSAFMQDTVGPSQVHGQAQDCKRSA